MMSNKKAKPYKRDSVVLVCVLKSKRDLGLLLKEHWYRIPVSHAPVRRFDYLAFYLPRRSFQAKEGLPHPSHKDGKSINYYTRVKNRKIRKRVDLLPAEKDHPKAKEPYIYIKTGNIMRLRPPVKNISPRRVSFGFTTLSRLKNAKNILEVYDIFPIEEIIGDKLKKIGIKAIPQRVVSIKVKGKPKRYRLDFAVYCRNGKIAIECDNEKAHSSPVQKRKDQEKDMLLREDGWRVLRIREKEAIENIETCIKRVKKAVQKLGGQNK